MTIAHPPDALRTIWTRPRGTVRWLVDEGRDRLWPLLVAGEVVSLELFWEGASVGAFGRISDEWSPGFLLLKLLAWTAAFLVLSLTATVVGRILRGVGTFRGVLVALAWAFVPGAAALPFVGLAAVARLFGEHRSAAWLLIASALLGAWGFVLAVRAVAEAHRVHWLRGALAVAIGTFLAYAPVLALWAILGGLLERGAP